MISLDLRHMYKHITNGLNDMSVEDFWWFAQAEIKELGLQKQFDKQIKKMGTQEKHKYKEVHEVWEYALKRIQE